METKNFFKVLHVDWNKKEVIHYDVLPLFRSVWNDEKWSFEKDKVKTKEDLKEWITRVSKYYFWSKCEQEMIVSPWPYHDMLWEVERMKRKNLDPSIMVEKMIEIERKQLNEMHKVDIHEQIMMNIDIIIEILSKEFNI